MIGQFFRAVRDEARPDIDARRIAVVVAHPDDETIGCGALLARLKGVRLVVVTDGAPKDTTDRESYAACRSAELVRSLRIAGIPADAIVRLGVTDQQAAFRLTEIAASLARLLANRDVELVLTHACEGGHPDHDATAFCVQRAARRAWPRVSIIEMPYYRVGPGGEVFQCFAPDGARSAVTVFLNEEERTRKHRMFEAYETQKDMLANFSLAFERFRTAANYDFGRLPNGGDLLYERHGWGLTGGQWLACVRAAEAHE